MSGECGRCASFHVLAEAMMKASEGEVARRSPWVLGGVGAMLGALGGLGIGTWLDFSLLVVLVGAVVGFLVGCLGGNQLLRHLLEWL